MVGSIGPGRYYKRILKKLVKSWGAPKVRSSKRSYGNVSTEVPGMNGLQLVEDSSSVECIDSSAVDNSSYFDFGVLSVERYDVSDSKIALVTTYTGTNPFNIRVVDLNHIVSSGDGRRTSESKRRKNREQALSVIGALDQYVEEQDVSVIGDAEYREILQQSGNNIAVFLMNK